MTHPQATLHYRPREGKLADTIPFFWNGNYHIFYLHAQPGKIPWEHVVSTDLVHWQELPTALVPDGDTNGPDGEHMFTGSVIEQNGTFHIFYTGWNPRNPAGREWILHATSPDLVSWTKHPEHGFRADGNHYQNTDFRDPFVFWNETDRHYWMTVCARDAKTGQPVQGILRSENLTRWLAENPLTLYPAPAEGALECPDIFTIGDRFYLIHSPSAGSTVTRWATDLPGTFRIPLAPAIDTPFLYAAKRMFDGRRHIITGWLRDLLGDRDGGAFEWGGSQSMPREVYAGPDGQLRFRPVSEARSLFTRVWLTGNGTAIGQPNTAGPGRIEYAVPPVYHLDCTVTLPHDATFTVQFHRKNGTFPGYRLVLNPSAHQASIEGPTFRYPRNIPFSAGKPVHIQAFVEGSIIECFIDDGYVFSCRAYEHDAGTLDFKVSRDIARLLELRIRTPASQP